VLLAAAFDDDLDAGLLDVQGDAVADVGHVEDVAAGAGDVLKEVDEAPGPVADPRKEPGPAANTKSWKPGRRVLIPRAWVEEMSWAESRIHMKVGRQKLKTSARYDPPAHTHTDERARPFLWP
jgi:hypothetical protein